MSLITTYNLNLHRKRNRYQQSHSPEQTFYKESCVNLGDSSDRFVCSPYLGFVLFQERTPGCPVLSNCQKCSHWQVIFCAWQGPGPLGLVESGFCLAGGGAIGHSPFSVPSLRPCRPSGALSAGRGPGCTGTRCPAPRPTAGC